MIAVMAAIAVFGLGVGLWNLRQVRALRRRLEAATAVSQAADIDQAAQRTQMQLLETVLDAAPLAVVLCDAKGVVALANRTARDLFFGGVQLIGADFDAVLERCPPSMARAVRNQSDVLFTVGDDDGGDGDDESYHLSRPALEIDLQRYTLYLIKELTRELGRQEVAIWKKMIRVVSHELNNSLAPVSSLLHSARLVYDKPEHRHRMVTIFDTIEERIDHLQTFIEGYARFAKLAPPAIADVAWGPFLESVATLFECRLTGTPPAAPARIDASQVQQALINLLKNAQEAGGPADAVELTVVTLADGGVELSVLDAGTGMSDDVMRQATLPFYSTKNRGTGLGLALCREIVEAHGGAIRLEHRRPTGLAVHLTLP
ncbi:MAG: two-component system nitrogen regulation sensor histidine kinase NtrY [Bradymonadia bacterium]